MLNYTEKNPKHLYPKLNGYGDNGHRKVWASGVSTHYTPSVTSYSSNTRGKQCGDLARVLHSVTFSAVAQTLQDKRSAGACVKYLEVYGQL